MHRLKSRPMALLPIFCVARFSRTDLSMLVARALKIGKIADAVCLLLMRRCTSAYRKKHIEDGQNEIS